MDNAMIVKTWIAEDQPDFDRWIKSATEQFWSDTSVRLPRTPAERENNMAVWLDNCRAKLSLALDNEFRQCFPSLAAQVDPGLIRQMFNEHVWPNVEPTVRRYALRGLAATWVGGHVGDATTVGWPEPEGPLWRVPLRVRDHGENMGQVMLNADGDVLPNLTTTRDQILEELRGRRFPAVAAAARQ